MGQPAPQCSLLYRDRPTGAEIASTRPDLRSRTFKDRAKRTRQSRGSFWLAPSRACQLFTERAIGVSTLRVPWTGTPC